MVGQGKKWLAFHFTMKFGSCIIENKEKKLKIK